MGKPLRSLRITIDNQSHLVDPGTTVLDAAKAAGIPIPTLCHLDGCKPPASCMVCLVKDLKTGANFPSCATEVIDGMELASETEEVHALRRTAIELLLSDHVGDCLAPCTLACPLHADVPTAVRLIRQGKTGEATELLRWQLPMATLLERLCTKPCEKACRRGRYDRSVAIPAIHQTLTDQEEFSPDADATVSSKVPSSGTIAIIGGGMAGLSAAHFLNRSGYEVTVFDQAEQLGGRLLEEMTLAGLPNEMLEEELKRLERRGIILNRRSPVDTEALTSMFEQFDAILIAAGAQASNCFGDLMKRPACFAAGDALKPEMPILRRATSGRDAAIAIDAFMGDNSNHREQVVPKHVGATPAAENAFSVRLGKLNGIEMNLFVADTADVNAEDMPSGLDEAARCFLCDCSDLANCKLRQYAIEYGADPRRYKVQRRELVRQHTPSGITFESGKCIRCGRCIEMLKQDPDAAGLTFVGRGFDVILSTPIGRTLDEALGRMADACCEACPTGALMSSHKEK